MLGKFEENHILMTSRSSHIHYPLSLDLSVKTI